MGNKNLLILTLLLYSLTTWAQNHAMLIGFKFSPDICYRKLSNNSNSDSVDVVINNRNEQEAVLFGFTTGFNLGVKLGNHFTIETGIQYSAKGYRKKYKPYNPLQQNDPFIPELSVTEYKFKYFEIPIGINYSTGSNRLRFYSSAGIIGQILVLADEEKTLFFPGGRTEKSKQASPYTFNRFMLSAQVSAGIALDIGKRIELRIDPAFRYGLLKINDTPVTANLWSAGLQLACYYRF